MKNSSKFKMAATLCLKMKKNHENIIVFEIFHVEPQSKVFHIFFCGP